GGARADDLLVEPLSERADEIDAVRQRMRAVQESAAATAGDELVLTVSSFVTRVVVQVAGDAQRNFGAGLVDQVFEKYEVLMSLDLDVFKLAIFVVGAFDPGRFRVHRITRSLRVSLSA